MNGDGVPGPFGLMDPYQLAYMSGNLAGYPLPGTPAAQAGPVVAASQALGTPPAANNPASALSTALGKLAGAIQPSGMQATSPQWFHAYAPSPPSGQGSPQFGNLLATLMTMQRNAAAAYQPPQAQPRYSLLG